MFSRIGKRLSYTNIALTLALLFAMTGGAYASKFIITSTKQIRPSVLKQLQGKTGANGAPGKVGATGPAGPQGPAGPGGTKGENGGLGSDGTSAETSSFNGVKGSCAAGGVEIKSASPTANVCNGKEGKEGKEGSPWTAGGTLPLGKSETGTWSTIYTATAAAQPMTSAISFTVPLKAEPETHYIKPGETPPTGCSGTIEKPEAASGNLCVFTEVENRATEYLFEGIIATHFLGTSTTGTIVTVGATEAGEVLAFGHWAVTGN